MIQKLRGMIHSGEGAYDLPLRLPRPAGELGAGSGRGPLTSGTGSGPGA